MEETVINVVDLKKYFPLSLGFLQSMISRKSLFVRAVDGISFDVKKGEIFALAGESGSGKTTTGRMVLRLIEPTSGKIYFHNKEISRIPNKEFKAYRKRMQIIFQDPYESLNPKMTIRDIIAEPLNVQGTRDEAEVTERVNKTLEDVELTPPQEFVSRFPHELSGGQRQRVASARALVVQPEFIVADEPVSMLDVSIRAEILNLMIDLVEKYNVSFLYITHDLALARHICHRIAVMYLGKIVEKGSADDVILEPLHPYTRALMEAVPVPDPTSRRSDVVIKGEIPSPVNPPSGCRFHTRCPAYIGNICRKEEPPLFGVGKDHYVACHLYSENTKRG
jgi:peptide/nickel transport system ATP-binding protein